MIPQEFSYSRPETLQQALALIADGATPIAGGMSLIPMMKLRLAAPEHVVDLGRLGELNYIRESGGEIRIGAMSTHYDIESSPLLRARCPLLPETAGLIGDMQVRNRGTIGGSIAHADPAADYPASLIALEARVRLVGPAGERTLDIAGFFVDAFTTAREAGEIVTEIVVPASANRTGSSYQKVAHPASGFALVGVAASVTKAGGAIERARVGVTGLASRPYRAAAVERVLEGSSGTEADVLEAAAQVADGVEANSDLHASAEYRNHLARVYARRAILIALSRIA
jgi:carbon-monoxide dehydrogenase medium subunit